MTEFTIIALLAVAVFLLAGFTLLLFRGKRSSAPRPRKGNRDREAIVREANRALSQNPKDAGALQTLADLYFTEQAWDKAYKTYAVLVDICATNPDLDSHTINLRHGLCALELKQYEIAYKSLVFARSLNAEGFDLNYGLGVLEYRRKAYEKAVSLLRAAHEEKPEHIGTARYLAQALYKVKKYNDAIALLRRLVDVQPDDKEALFVLGQAYFELGQEEQAARIFSHLRTDPAFGPRSALLAGTIRLKHKQYEKAQTDFELGLRHEQIHPDVAIELRYRLAGAYTKTQQLSKALSLLDQIQDARPAYKDVPQQIGRMRELASNKNLQTFLVAGSSEFVALCRKVTDNFFPQARVKVTDVSVTRNEYADILAEVETSSWVDLILFRYIRTTGQVGELALRDFHARLKDLKAGRGFCLTAGTFTDTATQFVEARLIDLIDKEQLVKILNRVA